jgi:hypothetical protein
MSTAVEIKPPLIALIHSIPELQQCSTCPAMIVVCEYSDEGIRSEYCGKNGECHNCFEIARKAAKEARRKKATA